MSIDRIGPKPPHAPGPGSPARAGASGAEFRVSSHAPSAPAVSEPLARLRAGQVDRAGYVDLHVTSATAHLRGLPAEARERVEQQLRDRCTSDPLLCDLIERATR
jgi:hypothetical protein